MHVPSASGSERRESRCDLFENTQVAFGGDLRNRQVVWSGNPFDKLSRDDQRRLCARIVE
jgi:hypothetical protein